MEYYLEPDQLNWKHQERERKGGRERGSTNKLLRKYSEFEK